jgi:hypothetical protein
MLRFMASTLRIGLAAWTYLDVVPGLPVPEELDDGLLVPPVPALPLWPPLRPTSGRSAPYRWRVRAGRSRARGYRGCEIPGIRNCYKAYLLVPLLLPDPLPIVPLLPDGLDGLVLPPVVAPEPEPPFSSRMHFSRSAPLMVAHLAGTSVDDPVEELPVVPPDVPLPLEPDV